MTEKILEKKPNKFIIIEKDFELYKKLLIKFDKKKITIINDDALLYDFSNLKNFKLISNLPYNISSKFLLKLLKLGNNISEIICMIQSELADKFEISKGKMNKYRFISNYTSSYEIKFNVSQNVFYPKPKVNSKVVKFDLKKQKLNIDKLNFFMEYFFINKRKKIKSNMYFTNKINNKYENIRYEELNLNEILEIYKTFNFTIS